MGFWIYMLCISLLMPVLMIILGARFRRRPPKSINAFFGYRTRRSMINRDTWAYAHRFFGRIWLILGLILLPLSVVYMCLCRRTDADTISRSATILCLIQLVILIVPIFFTEKAIRQHFDDDGNRK